MGRNDQSDYKKALGTDGIVKWNFACAPQYALLEVGLEYLPF